MISSDDTSIRVLNNLITFGLDAERGFQTAAVHRQWMDLEAATSDRISQAILTAAERGEALAVAAYGEALQKEDLDEQTRKIVQQQYEQVQAVHDRVKQLRERAAAR